MRSEQVLNLLKAASSDMISFIFSPQERLDEGKVGLGKYSKKKITLLTLLVCEELVMRVRYEC